jgi:hypothetical protein
LVESVIKTGLKSVFGSSEARSTAAKTNPSKAILARSVQVSPAIENQSKSNQIKPNQTSFSIFLVIQSCFWSILKFFQKALAFRFASGSLRAPRRPQGRQDSMFADR